MGERRALVIASQCESLNLLSFLPEAAREVADALFDPELGGCVSALPDDDGVLVDPTMARLDEAITRAFALASEDEATLFVALVGHGEYANDDFYFLASDARLPPSSRTAFLLAQRIKELLGEYSMLDGLVLLLDTCHAGIAANQAAMLWVRIVGDAGRRFEVLTASDERTAANGCFSRSLAGVLRSGHPRLGQRLRCPDLKPLISGLCPAQTAVHLAFDGRRAVPSGDEGLWLSLNAADAWRHSALAGNPAATEVERLTEGYRPDPALGRVVGHLLAGTRCVVVTGPPMVGKSSLLAALARPSVAESHVPPRFLHAVLFVRPAQTMEQLADELARQLGRFLPGLAAAAEKYRADVDQAIWDAADAFTRSVIGPLRTIGQQWTDALSRPVRIAVDCLDDLEPSQRRRVDTALRALATDPALSWVQLVVASRTDRHLVDEDAAVEVPLDTRAMRVPRWSGPVLAEAPKDAQSASPPGLPAQPPPQWYPGPFAQTPWEQQPAPAGPPTGSPAPPSASDGSSWPAALGVVFVVGLVAVAAVLLPWWTYTSMIALVGLAVLGRAAFTRRPRKPRGPIGRWQPRPVDGAEEPQDDEDAEDDEQGERSGYSIIEEVLGADVGRPIPIAVLTAASRRLGGHGRISDIRDELARNALMVSRNAPGTPEEQIRLRRRADEMFAWQGTHGAMADAIAEVAPIRQRAKGGQEQAYADAAEAEHLWLAGRHGDALSSLERRASDVPVENREQWTDWHERVAARFGPDHPLRIRAQAQLVRWTARAGDPPRAREMLTELLPVAERVVGHEDRDLLGILDDVRRLLAER